MNEIYYTLDSLESSRYLFKKTINIETTQYNEIA